MRILKVEDMHCGKCVERITKALLAEGIQANISLDEKTVAVDEASADKAVSILDEIGFDAK